MLGVPKMDAQGISAISSILSAIPATSSVLGGILSIASVLSAQSPGVEFSRNRILRSLSITSLEFRPFYTLSRKPGLAPHLRPTWLRIFLRFYPMIFLTPIFGTVISQILFSQQTPGWIWISTLAILELILASVGRRFCGSIRRAVLGNPQDPSFDWRLKYSFLRLLNPLQLYLVLLYADLVFSSISSQYTKIAGLLR
jgi:hypothetical protein